MKHGVTFRIRQANIFFGKMVGERMAPTIRQSKHAPSPSTSWRFALRNPRKCLRSRVQPLPRICSSNRTFPPIPPGSDEPAYEKSGFARQQFDDVKVAQYGTKAGTPGKQNPIYVLFLTLRKLMKMFILKKRKEAGGIVVKDL
jgi:hypothetical protein